MVEDLGFTHRFVPGSHMTTLLLLHGTGGNETDLLDLGRTLLPGAALLSPRGKVLENGMPRFFRRLAEGVFDLEDLHARTAELASFLSRAAEAYGRDPAGLIAVGYSNGANIAASLLLSSPGALAGAVLLHAMPPFEPEAPVDLRGRPVLLTAGRRDPIVGSEQALHLAELLRRSGAAVELEWMPGGHELTAAELQSAAAWLARVATA